MQQRHQPRPENCHGCYLCRVAATSRRSAGRPGATTHGEIEQAAFALFGRQGFERTTVAQIAAEVGISARTLFAYYPSKADIPWGQFALTLARFEALLDDSPDDLPLSETVHRAVVEFNRFDPDSDPPHRDRMRLILETPALQAHSVLRYREWRGVIARYVAGRLELAADDYLPQIVGQVSLALALAAYNEWLRNEDADLIDLLSESMTHLRGYLLPD